MATVRFVVSGRVQGVGYRAFVLDKARELGIRGEVWNRADGWVEIVAQHEEEGTLGLLRESLAYGPGTIAGVDEELIGDFPELQDFKISFTR